MKLALVSMKIDRFTNKVISREAKEIKEVDEDEYYKPLIEMLGDEFLKHKKESEVNG
ncbi:hypothetical protein [Anaerosalibacter massiliensis]|uniref:Uncharacterized protein n=1 Tax=Anaerosalibacter massiliensis TaxID=1347392 RepID=A0A9X2S6D0_9FIRM|nr:hypothetical protein [Anaerosalibacter massiliensis]MCR2045523.1 hypothetical protein [Anaerosalibacter massiliensis]